MAKDSGSKGTQPTPAGMIGTPGTKGYSQANGTRSGGAKGGKKK